jgi:hypothetical protein
MVGDLFTARLLVEFPTSRLISALREIIHATRAAQCAA